MHQQAMHKAIKKINTEIDILLIDGNDLNHLKTLIINVL